jgi:hypothetical protein
MIGVQPGSSVGGSNRGSSGGGHNNVNYSNPTALRGNDNRRKPPGHNMAYINVSSDGNRLVGPLGLKKAE